MNETIKMLEEQLIKLVDSMSKVALKDYNNYQSAEVRLKEIQLSIDSICRCISNVKYFEKD